MRTAPLHLVRGRACARSSRKRRVLGASWTHHDRAASYDPLELVEPCPWNGVEGFGDDGAAGAGDAGFGGTGVVGAGGVTGRGAIGAVPTCVGAGAAGFGAAGGGAAEAGRGGAGGGT